MLQCEIREIKSLSISQSGRVNLTNGLKGSKSKTVRILSYMRGKYIETLHLRENKSTPL